MSWKKYRKPLCCVIVVVLLLWLAVLAITLGVFFCGSETMAAKWGQFGDAFGVLNALFSGLALLGVIAALLMQREDIDLQLEEMRESVTAQKAAAAMQEKQARIAALAEMLRASEAMTGYYQKHEQQPTTHSTKGENPPTKKQFYEQKIPELVKKLETELNGLQGDNNP